MQLIEGYEGARAALQKSNAARAFSAQPEIEARVRDICEAVRAEGDEALLRFERQFDCATFELGQLRVAPQEIEAAWQSLPGEVQSALQRAADNIAYFHRKQPVGDWTTVSPDGVFLGQRYTPIERVGLYAPGGLAAYPSTVLMIGIPAQVAGVSQVVLCSPPAADGSLHPVILAAARVAGITEIYRLGGAPAMAAMALGTASVRAVDKLVGPGNLYVTLAKKYLYGTVGIDGLYGPSEVVVLCDHTGRRGVQENSAPHAAQLAADLVAQAEHGADSFVCLVATSRLLCAAVMSEVESQMEVSPRKEVLRQSLQNALVLCVDSLDEACALCDEAAPEHLEIWSRDALALSTRIRHAGAIFLNTPVPLGDYIAGPSHTLPTGATARFAHGVGVETFLKRTSLIAASSDSIARLANDLNTIAHLEDLPGHAAAVQRAAQGAFLRDVSADSIEAEGDTDVSAQPGGNATDAGL
ncbi:MAG TPA: histidinol dehydrogenase [Abditibacteriaceae bacterium]|jgi:histidinol dehydrogenase